MSSRHSNSKASTSLGFRGDLHRVIRDLGKQTSRSHKQFVLLLILLGAVLRGALLWRPISYEEAFAYVEFATQPIGVLISDYRDPVNHILHTLLTKLSTGIFGVGLVQLRLPAFLAGVLVLPLFYLFVRAMFNRYIAMMALALVVASGPLIEYSAIARGYSIVWLCFVTSLMLGRHMIKENNATSAILIGVVGAIGMWSTPVMAYPAVLVYLWILFSLTAKYENTLRQRVVMWLASIGVFLALSGLLYAPVIMTHGVDQLLHHRTVAEQGWDQFVLHHADRSFDLWAYIIDSSAAWVAVLGFLGMFYAVYISSKFRFLVFAMLLGTVPLVMLKTIVGAPPVWTYTLFVFHLSTAIAVFYVLKFLQEKLFKGLGKRTRTAVTSMVLLVGFAIPGMTMAWERTAGMPEAHATVAYAKKMLRPGDKLYVEYPWDSPVIFNVLAEKMDPAMLHGDPAPGAQVLAVVVPKNEQTVQSVLAHNRQDPSTGNSYTMVLERGGLKIFAAP